MVVLDVYIPTGKLGVMLKDGIDVGGFVTVIEILEGSQMFGELMESITGAGMSLGLPIYQLSMICFV
jgi:hypothetical protein